jgi:hypothetical protein
LLRLLRRINQNMKPAIKASRRTPPITPPAMAPTLGPDFVDEPVLVGETVLDLVAVPAPVAVVEARVETGEDSVPPAVWARLTLNESVV